MVQYHDPCFQETRIVLTYIAVRLGRPMTEHQLRPELLRYEGELEQAKRRVWEFRQI
jgi:hypothetical protein